MTREQTPDPDYIDRALEQAGEQWRSRLAPPADVDVKWFATEDRAVLGRWAFLAAAAVLAVLVAAFSLMPKPPPTASHQTPSPSAVGEVSLPPTANPTAAPSPTAAPTATIASSPAPTFGHEIVHEGDMVTMSGSILGWDEPVLCADVIFFTRIPPIPSCPSSAYLPVKGIDPRSLPGYETSDVWVTTHVTVVGAWRDGAIEVAEAVPTEEPPGPSASPRPPAVVSAGELHATADLLDAEDIDWYVEVDPSLGRVVVTLPVLDEHAAAVLAPYLDMLDIRPLAVKVDDASPLPAFPSEIVRDGDLVSVSGRIIDWSAGPRVCTWMVWNLSSLPQPGCVDGRDLPITGIDPRDLSGAEWISAHENFDRVWVTDSIRVFGIWRNGVIQFVDAIPAKMPPSPGSTPPVPCDPPIGGWPGDPYAYEFDPGIIMHTLPGEVARHAEVYGGVWSAEDKDSLGNVDLRALVIGTVVEVSTVEDQLRDLVPVNICVVPVEYNALELEAVAKRLRAENRPGWKVEVDPAVNRVAVWLPVIDQAAADILRQDLDKVDLRPVADKADADPPPNGQRLCPFTDSEHCAFLVALAREARPDLFTPDSVEIVDITSCRPGMMGCPFLATYIVVVVHPGCADGPIAFSVEPRSRTIVRKLARDYELPSYVTEVLPAECGAGPPA